MKNIPKNEYFFVNYKPENYKAEYFKSSLEKYQKNNFEIQSNFQNNKISTPLKRKFDQI